MHEINKIQGHAPKKIFVEMTRKDGVKGDKGRKESRKTKLVDLYKKCSEDSGELWESLEKTPMMNLKETDCIFTILNSASVCTRRTDKSVGIVQSKHLRCGSHFPSFKS